MAHNIQSYSWKCFINEKDTLIRKRPGAALELEASDSNFPYRSPG